LAKFNKQTVYIRTKKCSHILRHAQKDLGLKVPGSYSIPHECGKVYVGHRDEPKCNTPCIHTCTNWINLWWTKHSSNLTNQSSFIPHC